MSLRTSGNHTPKKKNDKAAEDAAIVNGAELAGSGESIDVIAQTIKVDEPSVDMFAAVEGTAAVGAGAQTVITIPANAIEVTGETASTETIIEQPKIIDIPDAPPIATTSPTHVAPAQVITIPAATIPVAALESNGVNGSPTATVVGAVAQQPNMPAAQVEVMQQLDISKVAPRLYVSSAPTELAYPYVGFTMIVLCAEEYQPELAAFQGKVIRAGFNDTPSPTQQDLGVAANTADTVYQELVAGGRVLVTCAAGRNRSCLVVGLVLGRKLPAADVISMIRAARGDQALSNPTYRQLVELCAVKTVSVSQRTRMGIAPQPIARPAIFAKNMAPPQAPTTKPRGLLSMILGTGLGRQRGEGKKVAVGVGRGHYGKRRARGAR